MTKDDTRSLDQIKTLEKLRMCDTFERNDLNGCDKVINCIVYKCLSSMLFSGKPFNIATLSNSSYKTAPDTVSVTYQMFLKICSMNKRYFIISFK